MYYFCLYTTNHSRTIFFSFPILAHSLTLSWRRQWHPTPVLLPWKSHGWRSLVGCSPWGRKESDTTERLHFHFSLSCVGEGNGNPLQCSCLENPRDGGAWWAAVFSRVQLFATPWTLAHQAPLSMGFPRQESWHGLPCPPPEDLLSLQIESASSEFPALADGFFTTEPQGRLLSKTLQSFFTIFERKIRA